MRTMILASLAALASGCFGGLKNELPPPNIYRVNAASLAAGAALPADLVVAVEGTAPGLDGFGIAGRWPGNRLDYLAGARWAEDVPALVESALIESLQATGRARSVQGNLGRFHATHTLVVEVRRFDADYTGGGLPVAEVALSATIGRASDRHVLASFTVSASEAAAENRQSAVVAALDRAFARATAELADRSFAAIAAELASASVADAAGAPGPRIAADDFAPLAGAPWNGRLTYQDYGSGDKVSIASVLVVSKARTDGSSWSFDFRYPREPQADTRDEYTISADGRRLNGERVVRRARLAADALEVVTEKSATDDDRPATVRHTYALGPGRFSIRKEVRYDGTAEFIERNRYDWTR